jgi:hypothetical protein
MEAKYLAWQRNQEASDNKYTKLEQRYNPLLVDSEELMAKLVTYEDLQRDGCDIRHLDQAGKPMKDNFVRHVRALLAKGSSARSVREQLYLNGGYFLSEKGNEQFKQNMPKLRWFQTQREGMGNENLLYSFLRIAKCEEVVQWGFDETSLNGAPTMNRWCRIN